MEILYAISLLLLTSSIASRFHWRPKGWAMAFGALFIFAGLCRIFMEISPIYGSPLSLTVGLLSGFLAARWLRLDLSKQTMIWSFPWFLAVLFIFSRSYFPQFDVDSLEYHLSLLQWLKDRPFLPLLQQNAEVVKSWYFSTGFEEYLSIPGLAMDLGLTAGLIAGVIKILTLFVLLSMIPKQWPLLRYGALFLLLIDDHFLFSSHSRSIYLNPSLIPLMALMTWFAWKGNHWKSFGLGMALGAVKYQSLYFLIVPVLGLLKTRRITKPNAPELFMIGSAFVLAASVFGLHFLTTGNPVAPVPNALFSHKEGFFRGAEVFLSYFGHESILETLSNPFRRLIFPGILALKMIAVLLVPTALLLFFRRKLNIKGPALKKALFFFLVVAGWACVCYYIRPDESRYHRYVLGVAIVGLTQLAMALRKPILPVLTKTKSLQFGVGLILVGYLVGTVDTRFFNVSPHGRPTWNNIGQFAKAKLQGAKQSLDLEAPYLKTLLMEEVQTDFPMLKTCLNEQKVKTGINYAQGHHLLVQGAFATWPGLLYGNNAMMTSLHSGGGYLRFPDGLDTLREQGVELLVVPVNWSSNQDTGPFVRRQSTGKLEPIPFNNDPVCQGKFIKVVRIASAPAGPRNDKNVSSRAKRGIS